MAPVLPPLVALIWLVLKQRAALRMMGIIAGPVLAIATLGSSLIVLPWAFLKPGRRQIVGVIIVDAILSLIIYADLLYFRQFHDLVSVASLRFVGQLTTVGGAVTELMRPADIWFWLDIPVLCLLALVPNGWSQRLLDRLPLSFTPIERKAAAIAALAGVFIVGTISCTDPILNEKYYGHSMVAGRMGLFTYHLFDVGSYAGRLALRATPNTQQVGEVQRYFEPRRATPPVSPLHGIAKGKNVIVLQVESLQAFTVGLTANGTEVTPNLNKLAKESLYFPDFYSQTGQGVTSDADLLANCSLYPTRTGAVYYNYASNDFRCMPDMLRRHGYKAVAMQGMPADFWNLATVYPRVGFEQYFSAKEYKLDEKIGLGLSDESFLRQSVAKLKSLPQPYYAFMVTLTSHGPFNFPGIPHELDLGPLANTQAGHYLDAVHYTDKAIGHFVDQLKVEGILENSILLIYGDHAGVNRSTPGIDQLLQIPAHDEIGLTQMEKRVPFLVHLPGGVGAQRRTHLMGQVDIAPTMAGLLDLPIESFYFMGQNRLAEPDGDVAFYNGAAVSADHLFSLKEGDGDPGRCYDRKTVKQVAGEECAALAHRAGEQLRVGRLIIERNLLPDLGPRPK